MVPASQKAFVELQRGWADAASRFGERRRRVRLWDGAAT